MGKVIESNEDFKQSIIEGRNGERFFQKYHEGIAKRKGYTLVNVANVPEWMDQDVDFLLEKDGEVFKKIEVKIDKRCDGWSKELAKPTGNVVYEVQTHDKYGRPAKGWCEKTKCDYAVLILGDCNWIDNILYVTRVVWIDMAMWRKYIKEHPSELHILKEAHPKSDEDEIHDYRNNLEELRNYGAIYYENTTVAGRLIHLNEV